MTTVLSRGDRVIVAAEDSTVRSPLARRGASRSLVQYLLGPELGHVVVEPGGRPRLPNAADVDVSISHTDDVLVVAIGFGVRIGVDIERRNRIEWDERFAARVCTPTEHDALRRTPARRRTHSLTWLWTVKEATLKALGTGLRAEPTSVEVLCDGAMGARRSAQARSAGREWAVSTEVHRNCWVTTVVHTEESA